MNFLKKISLKNLQETIRNTSLRFPVSVVIIFIVTTIFFILLHSESQNHIWGERLLKANISLIMAFVLSIGIYLAGENFNLSKLKQNLGQILTIIFAIIFYYNFSSNANDFKNLLNFFLNFSGIVAFLFFSFYLKNLLKKQTPKENIFYSYFYNLSITIFISYIFSGVLFALGMIAVSTTDALFNLQIDSKNTYGNWTIISLALISPFFLLTQIPNKKSFLQDSFKENKFFSFLVKYVAIPFIYIYFAILYAYSIKVLANFGDWPKGIITWMVIGFSIFGYLAYSFSLPFEKDSKAIKFFRKIFPFAVIPQVIMLFYVIYLRIAQYDFTINRYFVVVFGIWLILVSFHFIFSKKKNLIALPVSLFIIIIIISIIPKYNVYNFPIERQFERLKTDLQKANILQNGKIIPLKNYNDIDENLSKNIYSEINYLCNYDNCEKIKQLFPEIYAEILEKEKFFWEQNKQSEIKGILRYKDKKECDYKNGYYYKTIHEEKICFNKKYLEELENKKFPGLKSYQIKRLITEKIKVRDYYDNFEDKFIEAGIGESQIFPLNIDSYKEILLVGKRNINTQKYAIINAKTQELEIIKNGQIIKKINIKFIFDEIRKKAKSKESIRDWNKKDLSFKINKNYKIIFRSIYIPKNPKNNEKLAFDIYGYLLIK